MDERLCQAWRDAGVDLGIEVVAPFEQTLADGTVALCEAFLPHFGSRNGALALSDKTAQLFGNQLTQAEGLWCSILMAGYEKYTRSEFVDTLRDWGWFGPPDRKPAWLR